MTIVQATLDDVIEITEVNKVLDIGWRLVSKFYSQEWVGEQVSNGRIYIKRRQEDVAGAVCLSIEWGIHRCYIDSIAVRTSFQRQGIGRELVEFAKKYAQNHGCVKMWVATMLKYGVLEFYQKCGFTMADEGIQAENTEGANCRLSIDFPEQKS